MHQVNPAGDCLYPVDDAGEVLASGVGVACVEAETDIAGVADHIPEPGQVVEAARHRAVAACRVLDQHGPRPVDPLDRLAPALLSRSRVSIDPYMTPVHHQPSCADRVAGVQLLLKK